MYPQAICGDFIRIAPHPLGIFPRPAGAAGECALVGGVPDAAGDGLALVAGMAASLAFCPGLRVHATRRVAGLVGAPPALRGVRARLRPDAVSVTVPGELTVRGGTGPEAVS